MGFAVCNLQKAQGNDAAMSAHIERTIAKGFEKSGVRQIVHQVGGQMQHLCF